MSRRKRKKRGRGAWVTRAPDAAESGQKPKIYLGSKKARRKAEREAREKALNDEMINMLIDGQGTLDAAVAAEVNRVQDMSKQQSSIEGPLPGDPPPQAESFYFGRWRLETVREVPPCTVHKNLKGRTDVFVIHTREKGESALAFCSECQIDLAARLLRDILTYKDLRALVGRMRIPEDRIEKIAYLADMLRELDKTEPMPDVPFSGVTD